ncbi:MAG: dTDP-4-dehydrorhamnose 3,5-epimerase [Actinobacteria bacterium]|nr:dTDP-4-dehydrorhamnose 3,5-epimerase [Actinomycetota bacterium]
MIDGVKVIPLRKIPDERGCIYHMLRNDAEHFEKFGEIYFSTVYPGVVKAWHLHQEMALNYAVIVGMIKLVLFDDRDGSPTRGQTTELFIGQQNYQLVHVPPLVWNGFKGLGGQMAIVANCATLPHDPQEIIRQDTNWSKISYDWTRRDG